jgi:hypothetical protein
MRRPPWSATATAAVLVVAACGYQPVHGGPSSEHFAVVLTTSNIPDAVASDEVLAGVRDELARSSSLTAGESYPRCEIEVLRADEAAEGIGATPNSDGVLLPDARATRVGIVARGWIVRSKDGLRERDTGDVRATEVVSVAPDARAATFRNADALRAAGRRAGRRIGAHVLGLPVASD